MQMLAGGERKDETTSKTKMAEEEQRDTGSPEQVLLTGGETMSMGPMSPGVSTGFVSLVLSELMSGNVE